MIIEQIPRFVISKFSLYRRNITRRLRFNGIDADSVFYKK